MGVNYDACTKTEKRILHMLGDGLPHTWQELLTCLEDEMADLSALRNHISRLKKNLTGNLAILCDKGNYRLAIVQSAKLRELLKSD